MILTYCKKFACMYVCMDGFLYFSLGPGSIPLVCGYFDLIYSPSIHSSFSWQLDNEIEMCFSCKTLFDVTTTGTELHKYICQNAEHQHFQ